ncbi:TonB-dependent receptor [Opitutaceae bacterium EW11]|nr:TonB-dependent receptor [Opitutaceae bacterium EW11]
MNETLLRSRAIALAAAFVFAAGASHAQQASSASPGSRDTSATAKGSDANQEEDMVVLSPFEVRAENDGYSAATTLAGNRLNTELRDLGNSVSVVTTQFLRDVGATNNETLLQYTTNTEVGNVYGNFAGTGDGALLDESAKFTNPNQNTRVRGLTAADNTRDYFMTDIPWDGYNVDGVDLQRGPNSILFGQGSPAGIINTRTKQAMFRNANEVQVRFGSFGSTRGSLDLNRVLVKGELALRIAAVHDDEQFKQNPAFSRANRIYGATRWEPAILKKGGARTIFKANIEAGNVHSNRPRTLPPIDMITPWFRTGTYAGKDILGNATTYNNLNRETFIPSQLQDDNTGLPNHGQMRPKINGGANSGSANPAFNPWIGNFAQQFGGPMVFFDGSSPTVPSQYRVWEPVMIRGIGPDGQIDKGVGGQPYQRPGSIAPVASWAYNAHLPYSEFGIYKDNSLTDPSIFDFYNNLLDGPNKREWQSFRAYNFNLAQTFFNDQMGFEVTYNREDYRNGQISLLTGEKQAIYIDINRVYADGTPAGKDGEPFGDGTPNPNVGRPFISDSGTGGNNSYVSHRESKRLTPFITHDFKRDGDRWYNRLLGMQTVTGLLATDEQKTDERSWQRYTTDDAYEAFVNSNVNKLKINDNILLPNTVIYLGPSLSSRSSASGANIPRPTETFKVPSGNVYTFDSTWNKPTNPSDPGYVDPAAYWHNDYYPAGNTAGDSTQSENPANYVGWRNVPVTIRDSEDNDGANRDLQTTSVRLKKSRVSSRAFVYQGHFWDNSIVGTYGIRKDVSKAWQFQRNDSSPEAVRGRVVIDNTIHLPDDYNNRIEVTSKSWSLVAHLNQLPFLSKVADQLPVQVSVFYNKSDNFQPEAQRVDVYGEPIPAPAGKTTDKGILIETRDGRLSFKVNQYKTTSTNASSVALSKTWFIGASQAWGGNWANKFEFDLSGDTIDTAKAHDAPGNGQYNYSPAPGETQADADRREAAAIAGWRAWQKSVDPRFYKAWGVDINNLNKPISASAPNGFAVTEDSESKGYEFELSAMPTKNWRLTVNAAKSNAIRTNIGGKNLSAFIAAYEKALKTTAAGDLRIWWGGAGNETTLFQWNSNVGSEYAQRKLQEGTNVPELREWRINAITNYDFDHGFLKGFSVGGGVRWEDSIVIGYRPLPGATADSISFDIENPYMGPTETNFDFWVGYSRRIWRNVDWRIQLNVRNAFRGDELIPITTQPDGTPAGYRIAPPQTWTVTNTFSF